MLCHIERESVFPQLAECDDIYSFWAKILKGSSKKVFVETTTELSYVPCPDHTLAPASEWTGVDDATNYTASDPFTCRSDDMIYSHELSDFVTTLRIFVASVLHVPCPTLRNKFFDKWESFLPQSMCALVNDLKYDGSEDDKIVCATLLSMVTIRSVTYSDIPHLIPQTAEMIAQYFAPMIANDNVVTDETRYLLTKVMKTLAIKRFATTYATETGVTTGYGTRYHLALTTCNAITKELLDRQASNDAINSVWAWFHDSTVQIHDIAIVNILNKFMKTLNSAVDLMTQIADAITVSSLKFDVSSSHPEIYFGLDGVATTTVLDQNVA